VRLLKWLFHPVTLLIFIAAVAIYLNRNTLLPDLAQSSEVAAVTSKIDSLIASLESTQDETTNGNVTVGDPDDTAAQAVDIDLAQHDAAELPPAKGQGDAAGRVHEKSVGTDTPVDAPLTDREPGALSDDESPRASEAEQAAVDNARLSQGENAPQLALPPDSANTPESGQSSVEKAGDGVTEQPHGVLQPAPSISQEQLLHTWQQARTAAWYGDLNTAIEYYQTVITLQPDNYDAYGEMGNVMLRAGDREGAVEAYYQAARLLNKTPQRMMAWQLLNVIAGLSPAKAQQLYQELMESWPQQ